MLASPVDKSESSAALMRDELRQSQQSLASWQESWRQAKAACEAWKKEAEEVSARARLERESNCRRMEEVSWQYRERERERERSMALSLQMECQLHQQLMGGGVQLRVVADKSDMKSLPLSRLEGMRQQLRRDLDHLDSVSHSLSISTTNERVSPNNRASSRGRGLCVSSARSSLAVS